MRILIIANGEDPSKPLLASLRSRCDRFFAADGGGDIAFRLGFPPDLIIGDMDSYYPSRHFKGEIIQDHDQETNDLEKALNRARLEKAERVDVVAATGKRLDHTLKNLSVMQQFHTFFSQLAFYDDQLYSRIIPVDYTLTLPPQHPVSLFPISGIVEGITTRGLKYPLCDESLENGLRDGTSNETDSGSIRITHRSGTLLFMTKLTEHLL